MSARNAVHPIADIAFTDDESVVICLCGWHETGATAERIAQLYLAHRDEAGVQRRAFSDMAASAESSEFRINAASRERTDAWAREVKA